MATCWFYLINDNLMWRLNHWGEGGWRGKLFSEIPVILGFCFFWIRQMFNTILWNRYFPEISLYSIARVHINGNPGLIRPRTSINESNQAGSIFGQNQKYWSIGSNPPEHRKAKVGGGKRGRRGVPHIKLDFEYRLLTKILIAAWQHWPEKVFE